MNLITGKCLSDCLVSLLAGIIDARVISVRFIQKYDRFLISDDNCDPENSADARTYKYSQLLSIMVRFTIVNLREVHQNLEEETGGGAEPSTRKTSMIASVAEWLRG
jgi:hypothetical protein